MTPGGTGCHAASHTGFVVLANSHTRLRLMQPLAEAMLPGEHPAIRLLQTEVTE